MSSFFSPLTARGSLHFSGPDTHVFLQGQVTCNLPDLSQEQALAGAYCTPQGRLVCDFLARQLEDDCVLLSLHNGLCEQAAAVFGKYIVFSKAELSVSEQWLQYGLWGTDLGEQLALPTTEPMQAWQHEGGYWVALSGGRFEVALPAALAESFEQALPATLKRASEAAYQAEEIRAGIAHVVPETFEQLLPHALNYQYTGHLHFNKGCYTGQEIVARMHYKGKVKRPLSLARYSAAVSPAAGSVIVDSNDKAVGEVVNAAVVDGEVLLLANISDSAVNEAHIEQCPLEWLELPYPTAN